MILPRGLICHIGGHNFDKGFPIGAVDVTLDEKILQGIPPWVSRYHVERQEIDKRIPHEAVAALLDHIVLQGVLYWGHIRHIV